MAVAGELHLEDGRPPTVRREAMQALVRVQAHMLVRIVADTPRTSLSMWMALHGQQIHENGDASHRTCGEVVERDGGWWTNPAPCGGDWLAG